MVAKQSKVRPRDQQYRIDGDGEDDEIREDVQAFEIDEAVRLQLGAQRILRDEDGKEECRAGENDRARAHAEFLQPLAIRADHHHEDKELNENHDRHDQPRNQSAQKVPFDRDAVVQFGLQLVRCVVLDAKIRVVTVGAIAKKTLLNVPVFQNEVRIYPGQRSRVERGIRPQIGREVNVSLKVGVPQLEPNLVAAQRILVIIELLAQRRLKRPADQFFVALLHLVHLLRPYIFGFGQDEAFVKVLRQIIRVSLPDIPGYEHVVGSLELDGPDVHTSGDKNRRLLARLGVWNVRLQVTRDFVGGGHYRIGRVWRRWRGVHVRPHAAQYDQARERNERRHDPKPSPQLGNTFRGFLIVGVLRRFRLGKLLQEFCRLDFGLRKRRPED